MLFRDNKNKSIVRMLLSGMVILAICLVACMIHVIDVRNAFREDKQEQFQRQMFAANKVLSGELEKTLSGLSASAAELSNPVLAPTDKQIKKSLKENKNYYDEIIYISANKTVYFADGTNIPMTEKYNIPGLKRMTQNSILLQKRLVDGQEKYFVAVCSPVNLNISVTGHLVAYINIEEIFFQKAYETISSIGYCYITDSSGTIVAMSKGGDGFVGDSKNLFNGLIGIAHPKTDARFLIRDFQDVMRYGEEEVITKTVGTDYSLDDKEDEIASMDFTSKVGDKIIVSYQRVEGSDDLFFVCCYNENIVELSIRPVIFRSVLTCMAIIVLMIALIIYVWATSKKSSTTIEKMAYEDKITGGKNLNYFKDRVFDIMASNKEMPFLFQRFDIVNFRYINEAYGHKRADDILKGCIEMAEKTFLDREMCVRMDSDQFLLLTQNDGRVEQRRNDYIRALNEYARSIGIKYPIRLKFGIYQVRKNDREIEVMIDRANVARKSLVGDEKMLQAYYSDSIIREMRKIDTIESQMQKALDTGEFKIYLQPKWDIVNNKLSGAEALSRWQKPDRSMIMPNDFIPIFEKNGFIEKLDFYMLEGACRLIRSWIDSGMEPIPISVNQSRVLVNSPDYTKNVARILERYAIPKELIELELTETVFMADQEAMISTMNELKKLEICISMDDFGSGYSSLNMLKDVPFDVLKIDREFFSESITSESSTWILEKVMEMAHGLGIRVVCEGVETKEQMEILLNLGCKYVQGYYYSPPISIHEFHQKYVAIEKDLS